MRPLKKIIIESYWEIAFRQCSDDDNIVASSSKEYDFARIKSNRRYWYADPFLFEKDGKIYLFFEMFDNKKGKGLIGFSEFKNEKFTQPQIVLEEVFHLSFPFVFEENGVVYMMPETVADGCIQLYRAENFPFSWVKDRVILKIKNASDTVMLCENIITSKKIDPKKRTVQLEMYNRRNGKPAMKNPIKAADSLSRCAGRIFEYNGKLLRPAMNCVDVYGGALIFYEIKQNDISYRETLYSKFTPQQIKCGKGKICGTHTYARIGNVEVIDIQKKRFNPKKILWAVCRKLAKILRG